MELQQADGRWFQFSNQPTRQGGIVVTRTDTTNRKEMERALRESENLVRSIIDAAPVTVAMVPSQDGLVAYETPASRKIVGRLLQSGVPASFRDLLRPAEHRAGTECGRSGRDRRATVH